MLRYLCISCCSSVVTSREKWVLALTLPLISWIVLASNLIILSLGLQICEMGSVGNACFAHLTCRLWRCNWRGLLSIYSLTSHSPWAYADICSVNLGQVTYCVHMSKLWSWYPPFLLENHNFEILSMRFLVPGTKMGFIYTLRQSITRDSTNSQLSPLPTSAPAIPFKVPALLL